MLDIKLNSDLKFRDCKCFQLSVSEEVNLTSAVCKVKDQGYKLRTASCEDASTNDTL